MPPMPTKSGKMPELFGEQCSVNERLSTTIGGRGNSPLPSPRLHRDGRYSEQPVLSFCNAFSAVICATLTPVLGRFLYDGNRINDEDTPASLDMEDNGAQICTIASL